MGRFLTSTLAITVASFFNVGLIAVNGFVLALVLGPDGMGTLTLLISLSTLSIVLCSWGLQFAVVYYLNQKTYSVETVLSSTFWVAMATGTLLSILGFLFLPQLASFIPLASRTALMLGILTAIPQALLLYFGEAAVGLQDTRNAVLMRIMPGILYLLNTLLWVVLLHRGVTGAILAFFVSIMGTVLVGLTPLFRRRWIRLQISLPFVRDALTFGVKAHIGDIAQYLVYRADTLIVNEYAGARVVGQYSTAVTIAELVWLPSNTLRTALLARTTSGAGNSKTDIALISRNMLFISFVSGIGAFIAGFVLITLFLPKYTPAIGMLALLLPGAVTVSVFRSLVGHVIGYGQPIRITMISVGSLVLGLILYFLLIPRWGAYGAAISSTLLYTGEYLIILILLMRREHQSLRTMVVINRDDLRRLLGIFQEVWRSVSRRAVLLLRRSAA